MMGSVADEVELRQHRMSPQTLLVANTRERQDAPPR